MFLDALWSVSILSEFLTRDGKAVVSFLPELVEKGIVEKQLLITRMGEKAVIESGIVAGDNYNKKMNRISTMMNLWQTKYNLIKEANEGYSKVILVLLTVKDTDDPAKLYQTITCHIGNFDLDPDRVLDLILDSFIQSPGNGNYVELLKHFEKGAIPTLINQKLSKQPTTQAQSEVLKLVDSVEAALMELENNPESLLEDPLVPNFNLMRVMAHLIKEDIIRISEVTPKLLPSLEFLSKNNEKRLLYQQNKLREVLIVSTE